MPVHGAFGGDIPAAQDHLDFFPARFLALVANVTGTLAVLAVAIVTIRRRPLGNALVVGRGRRCRRRHRSIRLGCCEYGGFCCNCSTSSLRRFYSFVARKGTNQSLRSRSYRVDIRSRGLPRARSDDCGTVAPVSTGPRTRGGFLVPTTTAAFARAHTHVSRRRRPDGRPPGVSRGREGDQVYPADGALARQIRRYRKQTWRWQY